MVALAGMAVVAVVVWLPGGESGKKPKVTVETQEVMKKMELVEKALGQSIRNSDWAESVSLTEAIIRHKPPGKGDHDRIMAGLGADGEKFFTLYDGLIDAARTLKVALESRAAERIDESHQALNGVCDRCHDTYEKRVKTILGL